MPLEDLTNLPQHSPSSLSQTSSSNTASPSFSTPYTFSFSSPSRPEYTYSLSSQNSPSSDTHLTPPPRRHHQQRVISSSPLLNSTPAFGFEDPAFGGSSSPHERIMTPSSSSSSHPSSDVVMDEDVENENVLVAGPSNAGCSSNDTTFLTASSSSNNKRPAPPISLSSTSSSPMAGPSSPSQRLSKRRRTSSATNPTSSSSYAIPSSPTHALTQANTRANAARARNIQLVQESPTTQSQRRKRQRVAWEGILSMGTRSASSSSAAAGASSSASSSGRMLDALNAAAGSDGGGVEGLRSEDSAAAPRMGLMGNDSAIDLGVVGMAQENSPATKLRFSSPALFSDPITIPASSSPVQPFASTSTSTSLPSTPATTEAKEDEATADEDAVGAVRKFTLKEKMRAFALPGQGRRNGVMGLMAGGRLGMGLGPRVTQRYQVDTTSYLDTFTSHLVQADYRVQPNPDYAAHRRRDFSPVYACAYSNAAREGRSGVSLLALGSESGAVKVFDSNVGSLEEQENSPATSKYYTPHKNAIFDLKWSHDDSMIMTCAADQSAAIHSMDKLTKVASLKGHTSSVKTGVWYDRNIAATSGRDGNILIFDLRTRGGASADEESEVGTSRLKRARPEWAEEGDIYPVMAIRNAHGQTGKVQNSRSATKSVTSMVALKSMEYTIASAGSADGVIKLWDLRSTLASGRKQYLTQSVGQTMDRSMSGDHQKRSRGIVSLVEGDGMLFSLGYGSVIHAHSLASLEMSLPICYTHPNLKASSFYVKLAISPCSRYLACGSTSGGVFTWQIGQQSRKMLVRDEVTGVERLESAVIGTELGWNGHLRETGAVDWGYDQIVSCSDDYTNRVWRPNRQAAELIQREPANAAWHWAGVAPKDGSPAPSAAGVVAA